MALSDNARRFLDKNPTQLARFGGYRLYEHPTLGDESPLIMITPAGLCLRTPFYDLDDFKGGAGFDLCRDIDPRV